MAAGELLSCSVKRDLATAHHSMASSIKCTTAGYPDRVPVC
jgi:hypothetical protein